MYLKKLMTSFIKIKIQREYITIRFDSTHSLTRQPPCQLATRLTWPIGPWCIESWASSVLAQVERKVPVACPARLLPYDLQLLAWVQLPSLVLHDLSFFFLGSTILFLFVWFLGVVVSPLESPRPPWWRPDKHPLLKPACPQDGACGNLVCRSTMSSQVASPAAIPVEWVNNWIVVVLLFLVKW